MDEGTIKERSGNAVIIKGEPIVDSVYQQL